MSQKLDGIKVPIYISLNSCTILSFFKNPLCFIPQTHKSCEVATFEILPYLTVFLFSGINPVVPCGFIIEPESCELATF